MGFTVKTSRVHALPTTYLRFISGNLRVKVVLRLWMPVGGLLSAVFVVFKRAHLEWVGPTKTEDDKFRLCHSIIYKTYQMFSDYSKLFSNSDWEIFNKF